MKKVLSFLLVIFVMLASTPMCVFAETSEKITLSADVERLLYCPDDTVNVNINLSNNASGIACFRAKLCYDSENLTFDKAVCNAPETDDGKSLSINYSVQSGYIQILWDIDSDVSNYCKSGTVATLTFKVNTAAENKDYVFDVEYIDGARYVFSENFNDTYWEYITDVACLSDSMTINTGIPTQLYFENTPTGAYAGESVTLHIAFSGDGLYIFNAKLHFDAETYTVTECAGLNSALNLTYNVKDGYINLLWDCQSPENFSANEAIAEITFDVSGSAAKGTSKFELEYIDAVSIDLSSGVAVNRAYFNGFSCEVPLLNEKVPVNFTLNRGNGESETVVRYAGETLILPDTGFVDKNWYTSDSASIESIYTETVCPNVNTVLYSSAVAVDYSGHDAIVPYRFSQDFSVVKEGSDENLRFVSGTPSETLRMFRLSKVEDNVTYKLSVKYKASLTSEMGFGIAGATGNNMYVNTSFFEGDGSTAVYSINDSTDGYVTADIFFTASLKGTVTEQSSCDDIKNVNGNNWAYLTLINPDDSASNEILISELTLTKIGEAISVGGASLLNDSGYNAAENKQAIRYYFGYNTVTKQGADGEQILNIVIGDKDYEIVSRGFLYRNGAVDKYVTANSVTKEGMTYTAAANSTDIITKEKHENFNLCWEYNNETGKLCFSTYISGYTQTMYDYKLMVRGFVTFKDEAGNEFTVYSSTVNRSVNGIMSCF